MRLRWKICKALKIPLDDPLFERLTSVQALGYAHLIHKDAIEEEERWRDRIEYLARFWDNEAVEKVHEARRRAQAVPEGKFNEMLKHTFGRGLGSGISPEKLKTLQQLGQDIKKAST